MKKLVLIAILFGCSSVLVHAQDYNIGLRAGLNYSQLRGDLEEGETVGFSNGFHFGLNFQWNFTDIFGVRGELLYIQNGSQIGYEGRSYYIFEPSGVPTIYDTGDAKFDLKVSNAYVSIPITAHVELGKKWEVLGGTYVNFLVGPRGSGKLEYLSDDEEIGFFIQAHDYDFNDDLPGEANFIVDPLSVLINGDTYQFPKIVGAYYFLNEKDGNKYKTIDYGLVVGANYYLNPGFYVGFRLERGFRDLTNDKMDFALRNLDENNEFIQRSDSDKHLGMHFSLGFKF